MSLTFDGQNKLIICGAGTTSISLPAMWSRYKDWLLAGNSGFPLAFETVGGDPIDATTLVPLYLFQKNGWKIRPQEANHSLKVTDGILVVDGGGDPFVATLGLFSVRAIFSQPVQAFGYSTSGGSGSGATADQIAAAVRAELAIELAKLDVNVSSRMDANAVISGAPTTLQIAAAVRSELTPELNNLNASVGSRMPAFPTSPIKANVVSINNDPVVGTGTKEDPWRPA